MTLGVLSYCYMLSDGSFSDVSKFDFDSQKGVTHLLSSIRATDLSSDKKNELRDLVFLYANGGHDESVKITLTKKLGDYKVAAIETKPTEIPKPNLPFGTYRPSPTIDIPKPKVAVVTENKEDTKKNEVIEELKKVEPKESIPAPEVVVESTPETTKEPEPEPEPKSEPLPVVDVVLQSSSVPEPTQSYDPEVNLNRIKEIKALVNERVGNPVNLVDIDNQVGREYMSALLDAMKKINSGTSSISAMRRLEESFKAVQQAVETHKEKSENQPTQVTPVEVPDNLNSKEEDFTEQKINEAPSFSISETLEESSELEPVTEVEEPEPVDEKIENQIPIAEEFVPEKIVEEESPVVEEVFVPEPEVKSILPVPPPVPPPAKDFDSPDNLPISTQPEPEEITDKEEVLEVVEESPRKPEFIPGSKDKETLKSSWGSQDEIEEKTEPAIVSSLADAKDKPKTLEELPLASSLETSSVNGDPLYTKEIDKHLNDLLTDWPLFKKSGLFGTGPKGIEHPLFKKISGLQIPMLLAGRFEGATQDIKQSITDYMNGWRYEQGIVYHQGEDFEHYLRRVIKHILDLQKNIKVHN